MHVLVEYNNNHSELITECSKYNLTPVTLFKLKLNGKEQIKQQLEQIKLIKSKIKPEFSAIQVTLEKQENSSVGTVNFLKNDFDLVIGLGGLNKTNRFFLEDTQVDFLQDPQNSYFQNKTDFIHHFNSGLNQVLLQFAKDKEAGLIFSLNFTKGKSKNISKEIGRINQNIKLARKFKVPINVNFIINNKQQIKNANQLETLPTLFEVSTHQKKESIEIIEQKIKDNAFKRSENYITRGIEVK